MKPSSLYPDRVSHRPGNEALSGAVVYWMQQSQRAVNNQALDLAIEIATERNAPLWVLFVLIPDAPEANARHYKFMCEGIFECAVALKDRGIAMFMATGQPATILSSLKDHISVLVTDRGYLKWQREARNALKAALPHHPIYEVECDVIVPVELASGKEEYAAATLRPKLLKLLPYDLDAYSVSNPISGIKTLSRPPSSTLIDLSSVKTETDLWKIFNTSVKLDDSVRPVDFFKGGYSHARQRLDNFVPSRLFGYSELRGHPGLDHYSDLSPYLHFGQIAVNEVVIAVLDSLELNPGQIPSLIRNRKLPGPLADAGSFLEELIVRRELSCNFCWYNLDYDDFSCLPAWARGTLLDHLSDPRPVEYSLDRLENAQTDDLYWNLAQEEMRVTGKMNNYMRMYWGKKLIEWLPDPELAFRYMLWLNNRYELDGRDPNSFAGVAWCFGKHDRPWTVRPVFGCVRYMNKAGLERKFDMRKYVSKITGLLHE